MKPVLQSILGYDKEAGVHGDCFRACVASVLELSLEEVPHFAALPRKQTPAGAIDWWEQFQEWLMERGLYAVEVHLGKHVLSPLPEVWCIVTGKSPRGDYAHCCVGRWNGPLCDLIHDPSGSKLFFSEAGPKHVLFFAALNPEQRRPTCAEVCMPP